MPLELVDLATVKSRLGSYAPGMQASPAVDDQVLLSMIAAAVPIIEDLAGPVNPRTFVEQVTTRNTPVMLRYAPVLTLTSVVRRGLPLTTDDVLLDHEAGLISGPHLYGATVTYVAGRTEVPPTVQEATIVLLQHWWQYRSGTIARHDPIQSDTGGMRWGIPNAIRDVLGPELRAPRTS